MGKEIPSRSGRQGFLGRPSAAQPGLLVDSVAVNSAVTNGGEIFLPIGADAPEITACFRDPAGNESPSISNPNAAPWQPVVVPLPL